MLTWILQWLPNMLVFYLFIMSTKPCFSIDISLSLYQECVDASVPCTAPKIQSCKEELFLVSSTKPIPRRTSLHRSVVKCTQFIYTSSSNSWPFQMPKKLQMLTICKLTWLEERSRESTLLHHNAYPESLIADGPLLMLQCPSASEPWIPTIKLQYLKSRRYSPEIPQEHC